jgi:hypothetical protein
MPQLDFYSYIYQLSFIFLVSIIIYVHLIHVVLPTISITLKLRAYIIDTKVTNINGLIEQTLKIQTQIIVIIDLILNLLLAISEIFREDVLVKEIHLLLLTGKEVNDIINNDLLEEFLLQTYKLALIESQVDLLVDFADINEVFLIND